jgi:2-oxo-4-hydroxy-4-carboxy--5-ureidoimidazoline (OHCU) decarboxylase
MITRYKIRYRRPFVKYVDKNDHDEIFIRATTDVSAREKWEQLVKQLKHNSWKYVTLIDITPA